jgi:hypothetical protein
MVQDVAIIVRDFRYRLVLGVAVSPLVFVPRLILAVCDFLQDIIKVLVETGVTREY